MKRLETVAVLLLVVATAGSAHAWWAPRHEVGIRITGIGWQGNPFSDDPDDKPMLNPGAWPLTIMLTPRKDFLGYGTPNAAFPYPGFGGFVRWSDNGYYAWVFGQSETAFGDDFCPSWDGLANPQAWEGCELPDPDYSDPSTWWPIDETVVPFAPGTTAPASCSNSCDPGDDTCTPCEPRPEVAVHNDSICDDTVPPDNANCSPDPDEFEPCDCTAIPSTWPAGPPLGSADDGYGYGYSPRIPGLVIVADAGMSIVTENDPTLERPVRTDPLVCRNLAGFVTSVGHVLSDAAYNSHVTAQILVPGLFTPVALSDADDPYWAGGTEASCDYEGDGLHDDTLVVIDGLEPECKQGRVATYSSLMPDFLITLRAFVIQVDEQGAGVESIEDRNGNGYCDSEDYEMMVGASWDWNRGDPVLSREAVLQFTQFHFGLDYLFINDLDGDGYILFPVLPGGAGGLVGPPR